jgi:GNAT superfamily N-acetyltransferase
VNLKVVPELQGQGFGRKLVQAMETIGSELDCNKVLVQINLNRGFWRHMGYRKIQDHWEKKI